MSYDYELGLCVKTVQGVALWGTNGINDHYITKPGSWGHSLKFAKRDVTSDINNIFLVIVTGDYTG